MTTPALQEVAQTLLAARRDHIPADDTVLADAVRDAADAYAVQELVIEGMRPQQGFPRFWKSGGAAPNGLFPHAPLPAAGIWQSPAEASSWPFHLRLVEAEIALRLGRDVTPAQASTITAETAAALVDGLAVSIELVDSRWRRAAAAPALLKLADFQSHGALVLSRWLPFIQRDWAAQVCSVAIGNQPPAQWRGTHPLGDPVKVLPEWLRHITRHGRTAPAGTVVTTGTWCGLLPAARGDRVSARFEGVGEASVAL